MVNPKFVELYTEDGLTLPGLFYANKSGKKAAIYLHGNGSSSIFYDENKKRTLAEALLKKGIALLKFNNRGAHIIKKLNVETDGKIERKKYGMSYEIIKDCINDIDAAIAFLEKQGYKELYLIGSSTGANKICVYNSYKPKNKIKKFILLSAGDDTGIYYNILGKSKFQKLLEKAKEKIKAGDGEELITDNKLFPDHIFSYKSFFDIANPDGDYNCFPYLEVLNKLKLSNKPLFRYFKSINKPTLVIYGGNDEYAWGNVQKIVEILLALKPEFTYKIIPNADHGFSGFEHKLSEAVSNWLNDN